MAFKRSAGILLHPTSLPGSYGIGTLGKHAFDFVDFLASAGISLWQILPLGPTGYGDSPYQSLSAFAGNPYLIDPEALCEEGLISSELVEESVQQNRGTIDFGRLFQEKNRMLDEAWKQFNRKGSSAAKLAFEEFSLRNASWLNDFSLFMAIKESFNHRSWTQWPEPLKIRNQKALKRFSIEHQDRVQRHKFVQFLFFQQWSTVKTYTNAAGIRIIGDIPIFVALDSADTWAHPELFQLDEHHTPTKVAGVPPDYFTATGQLWGNPLYDWEANRLRDYSWWIERMESTLAMVDILRIDHFRGFESYWAVPAEETTAVNGCWEPGPGRDLFDTIEANLGPLPIIAEDLGFVTKEVHELRDSLGFPGMRILQFAFENEGENIDYPHTYVRNCVVYTGTHDNDTCRGWLEHASAEARARALRYLGTDAETFSWDMIRTAWASCADLALAPMQDFLNLGSESRMNFPGKAGGYWTWRMADNSLSPELAERIRILGKTFFRIG